ncbi:MAG TPA: hypothetical protein VKV02_00255, partial [Acidobacteriaceae bacterium]|nr:hypothetical protein [Acidobacteriaceae bacterium]
FNVMDGIARETGGRAFYGTNDVAAELVKATESGRTYYTLTYSPTDKDFDGKLRNIRVDLDKKGYQLAYRRSYYGTEIAGASGDPATPVNYGTRPSKIAQEPVVDTLSANMEHGAPVAHQLVFVVQAKAVGEPIQGTPEQMAQLATEPAYFKSRRKSANPKPLAPVPLQKDVFSFEIPSRQFKGETALDLEIAAAAYNADGQMMNAVVRLTKKEIEAKPGESEPPRFYRIDQDLDVPVGATSLRFAVRDTANDRTGAMEISLPLAPEGAPVAANP